MEARFLFFFLSLSFPSLFSLSLFSLSLSLPLSLFSPFLSLSFSRSLSLYIYLYIYLSLSLSLSFSLSLTLSHSVYLSHLRVASCICHFTILHASNGSICSIIAMFSSKLHIISCKNGALHKIAMQVYKSVIYIHCFTVIPIVYSLLYKTMGFD